VSDANIAVLAGSLLVLVQLIVVRVLDYYFPKGRMSRRAFENSVQYELNKEREKNNTEEDSHE
jgi:hypothetical protein